MEKRSSKSPWPSKSNFILKKVEYEPEKQIKIIKPVYNKIKECINKGAFKNPVGKTILGGQSDEEIKHKNDKITKVTIRLIMSLVELWPVMYTLKTEAFKEEKEWRLISLFTKAETDEIQFRISNNGIVPYREFKLIPLDIEPINKVIIGPKNMTPDYVIENILNKNGFKDCIVERSKASYR